MATFDSHQRSDLVFGMSAADLFGGAAKNYVVRIFRDVGADEIDLIEGLADRFGTHRLSVDPDREKDAIHAAFAHSWDIDRAIGIAFAQVKARFGEKALRRVIVRVDDITGEVEFVRTGGNVVSAYCCPRRAYKCVGGEQTNHGDCKRSDSAG